ncbi:epsin-2 [Trichonephila clavata]|uniref:Epsin-2 n=1 Tax=Trichonephila clavata TaxID=2740835 RepID=A0A8X6J1R6_TRICU|nr:epsin-2 [Trichonephila clavata]
METEVNCMTLFNLNSDLYPSSVIVLKIFGEKIAVCADTGASHTIAGEKLFKFLQEHGITFTNKVISFMMADGIGQTITALRTVLDLYIEGKVIQTEFLVLPETKGNKTLGGLDFLNAAGIVLDVQGAKWHFFENPRKQCKFFKKTLKDLNISMLNVQGLRRNVKNVVKNYSDAQVKVREATSNDPWGPSGTLMGEIADLTYNVVAFSEVMQVVWKRLNDHGKNWKHVYKALVLLDYLIKTGSEKVAQQCRENLFAIQTLKDFQYVEEGKDQGVNVREKAKQLVALLKDDERLKAERNRALKARERFARSTTHGTSGHFALAEFNQRSFDEEMSPTALSDLEQARPQTAGEEELQLQLALAMSKEEAEQSERLKRNDDLRLQMALSQSEVETKTSIPHSDSAMNDLLGLSLQPGPWDPKNTDIWSHSLPEPNLNLSKFSNFLIFFDEKILCHMEKCGKCSKI